MEKDINLVVEQQGTHNRQKTMELLLRFLLTFKRYLQSVLRERLPSLLLRRFPRKED